MRNLRLCVLRDMATSRIDSKFETYDSRSKQMIDFQTRILQNSKFQCGRLLNLRPANGTAIEASYYRGVKEQIKRTGLRSQ